MRRLPPSSKPRLPVEISFDTFRLRPWRAGDEPSLARYADDRRVWLNLRDRFPHPYTLADAERWVRLSTEAEVQTDFAGEVVDQAMYAVTDRELGR